MTSGADNLLTQAQLQPGEQPGARSAVKYDIYLLLSGPGWKRANATIIILFTRTCRRLYFTQISAGKTIVAHSLTALVLRNQCRGIMNIKLQSFCPSRWRKPQERIWSKISKLIPFSIEYYSNHRIAKPGRSS